ncbi:hypothetical protein [Maritalea sp.]|uniref:hypothetical protein n=1 Tax=Maritalea sp. TaxID=2003361 RepID=UPI003EFAEA60
MRFYPLFVGTFFLVSLIATVPVFHEYVVLRSQFEIECAKPIQDYVCFQDRPDRDGECQKSDPDFPNADLEFIRVFLNSPPLVKQATCSLERINFVHYLDQAPGGLFYEDGQMSIAWSMLKNREFLFADRVLWAHAGYKFKDLFVKYADRRELWIEFQQSKEPDLVFDPGFAVAYAHEIAHHIEQIYLQNGPQHCTKTDQAANSTIAPSNNCSFLESKSQAKISIDLDKDSGFTRAYDICSPKEQFAQAFSAYVFKHHFGFSFNIYADGQLALAQNDIFTAAKFTQKLDLAEALLSYDMTSPEVRLQLSQDHESCRGPFAIN